MQTVSKGKRLIPLEAGHWGRREFDRLIWTKSNDKKSVGDLTFSLKSLLPTKELHLVNSGRGALVLAMSVLASRDPSRQSVIIPDYICPAVPDAIRHLGLRPVTVPVSSDLNLDVNAALNRIDRDVLAIMPVHMYGNIADVSALDSAASAAGIVLIDNAAHVVGVKGAGGYIPGTGGAFGLVSFAQSKSIVCGYSGTGGVLAVNRDEYVSEARERVARLPPGDTRRDFEFALMGRKLKPTDALWRLRKIISRRGHTALESHVTAISATHAAIAMEQLKSLEARIDDKRRVADIYASHLGDVTAVSLPQYAPGRYLARIMVRFSSLEERNRIRSRLAESGIATRIGYPPVASANTDAQYPLLELPSGYDLPAEDIEFVARQLRKSL